jgi:meiotic recombination protein SPO11
MGLVVYASTYIFFQQGKGYPDVNTRRFLRRLWDELQLPPLGLMDSDPHGISIFLVYRFGSQVYDTLHRTLCDRC